MLHPFVHISLKNNEDKQKSLSFGMLAISEVAGWRPHLYGHWVDEALVRAIIKTQRDFSYCAFIGSLHLGNVVRAIWWRVNRQAQLKMCVGAVDQTKINLELELVALVSTQGI